MLISPSTKDAVISFSVLILEYWELTAALPEAAWTLEACEIANSLILFCFPPVLLPSGRGVKCSLGTVTGSCGWEEGVYWYWGVVIPKGSPLKAQPWHMLSTLDLPFLGPFCLRLPTTPLTTPTHSSGPDFFLNFTLSLQLAPRQIYPELLRQLNSEYPELILCTPPTTGCLSQNPESCLSPLVSKQ